MTNVKGGLDKLFKENKVIAFYVNKGSNPLVINREMQFVVVVDNDLLDDDGFFKKSNAIHSVLNKLYPVSESNWEDYEQDVTSVDKPVGLCEPIKVYDKSGWLI